MLPHLNAFKSAAKEVKRIVRSEEVNQYLVNNRTTWKFIVEKAPWWGGFWERMIRIVKSCLTRCIGKTTLSHDELNTLLVEVEAVVNSRPLTCVEDDLDGITYPLTPSHLIYGRRIANTPNAGHFEVISTHDTLTKRSKHQRRLLNHFTKQ